jgi:hypothetical protein
MYSIALDVDDVLAQFYPAMCVRFNKKCLQVDIWNGEDENEAAFVARNFHIIERNTKFWLNLDKLSRPQDINFQVDYYITSSPSHLVALRKQWLQGFGFPPAQLISTSNKIAEMRRLGVNVLIDDNTRTLRKVKEAGLTPIQFVPPYMRVIESDLNPITHLSQVPSILANLK